MAWPGDQRGIGGRRCCGRRTLTASGGRPLKAAFVQGRLTKDEFDARIGQTLASRVRGPGHGHCRIPGRPQAAAPRRRPGGG